jgi:hypothetical protein
VSLVVTNQASSAAFVGCRHRNADTLHVRRCLRLEAQRLAQYSEYPADTTELHCQQFHPHTPDQSTDRSGTDDQPPDKTPQPAAHPERSRLPESPSHPPSRPHRRLNTPMQRKPVPRGAKGRKCIAVIQKPLLSRHRSGGVSRLLANAAIQTVGFIDHRPQNRIG